jgi:uncharacterized protein YndB with AHSA1/START domain
MMARRKSLSSTEVPADVRPRYEAITALIDAFCKRHLNQEYAEMCRQLTLALAHKRPTPLARGSTKVWACGIVRTIGWANMLDDPKNSPYMKLIDIDPEFGVANSTGQGKLMAIKRMFGIGRLNVDWTLASRLDDNPVVWKVWIDGVLVDVRQESREKQEAAFHKGLIPYIPADREEPVAQESSSEFVTYIVTTPERLWESLTNGEATKQYFFGRRMESDWKIGSSFKLVMADGRIDSQGKVLEADPPRRLAVTWHVEWMEDFRHLPEAIVTFQIDPLGDVARFTVSEFHPAGINEKYLKGGRRGWPIILSGLKTLLETGRPLPKFDLPDMPTE